jgi:SAM-dependent methyltransferase
MNELAAITPRWGSEGRDRKAMAILRTMVSQCGDRITEGMWLDIGCGSGGIASALAPYVGRIIGIDPEPWPTWAAMSEAHPDLSFLTAGFDDDQLPLPKDTADVVICNQVYEHVAHPGALIRNIHRVLKPAGVCYFAGPNLLWPIEPHVYWPFVHWLPRSTARRLMRILGSKRADALDAFSASQWTLMGWFEGAGFSVSNILRARTAAGLALGRYEQLSAFAEALPDAIFRLLCPVAPGFVFLLAKPADNGALLQADERGHPAFRMLGGD